MLLLHKQVRCRSNSIKLHLFYADELWNYDIKSCLIHIYFTCMEFTSWNALNGFKLTKKCCFSCSLVFVKRNQWMFSIQKCAFFTYSYVSCKVNVKGYHKCVCLRTFFDELGLKSRDIPFHFRREASFKSVFMYECGLKRNLRIWSVTSFFFDNEGEILKVFYLAWNVCLKCIGDFPKKALI